MLNYSQRCCHCSGGAHAELFTTLLSLFRWCTCWIIHTVVFTVQVVYMLNYSQRCLHCSGGVPAELFTWLPSLFRWCTCWIVHNVVFTVQVVYMLNCSHNCGHCSGGLPCWIMHCSGGVPAELFTALCSLFRWCTCSSCTRTWWLARLTSAPCPSSRSPSPVWALPSWRPAPSGSNPPPMTPTWMRSPQVRAFNTSL